MKRYCADRRDLPPALSLAVVAALALAHWFVAYAGHVAYTVDSLTYRDAALNFLAGYPASATNVWQELPAHVPLLQWPPGYPALWAAIAAWGGLGIDAVPPLLNPLLALATALLTFSAARLLCASPAVAALLAVLHLATPASQAVFGHAWSETLFLPLVLLAFVALMKYGRHASDRARALPWLVLAATAIGLANWVRYAGALFLLLLPLTVATLPGQPPARRLWPAAAATLIAGALAAPLWWRNYRLSGMLSGSERGGWARQPLDRLLGDLDTLGDLLGDMLYNFDTLLRAHLEVPLLALALFLLLRALRRAGLGALRGMLAWQPLLWAAAGTVFLLWARLRQSGVDLDFRMLATILPFLLLACVPLVQTACAGDLWQKTLLLLLAGLLLHTGVAEMRRVRTNYLAHEAPHWRASFTAYYRDLSLGAPASRALKQTLEVLPPGTLVLTDHRPLYVRSLADVRAYAVRDAVTCRRWLERHGRGVLLPREDVAGEGMAGWALSCLEGQPAWRLLGVPQRDAGRGPGNRDER